MSERRNPFIEQTGRDPDDSKFPLLNPWEWNLGGLVRRGGQISFDDLKHRPEVYRPLLSALWVNNVESIPPSSHRTIEIKRYALRTFERYLKLHQKSSIRNIKALSAITRELLIDYRIWLNDQFSTSTAAKNYLVLVTLLVTLQKHDSPFKGVLASNLEIPLRSLRRNNAYVTTVHPYSRNEELAIERACKTAMNATLNRLNEGRRLLGEGSDPRQACSSIENTPKEFQKFGNGWNSVPNILWYIVNVLNGDMPNTHYADAAKEPFLWLFAKPTRRPLLKKDAYDFLYSGSEDIVPFIILLSLKTGLNAESLLNLKRDCLQGTEGGMTYVQYPKYRGSNELMLRKFSNRGANSPVGIIKTVLSLTEPLVVKANLENKNELWLAHQFDKVQKEGISGKYTNKFETLSSRYLRTLINGTGKNASSISIGFMQKNGITKTNGEVLKFSFLAARQTDATNDYIRHANLANVSKRRLKHHGSQGLNTTAVHYLIHEATHHIHNAAVRVAQDKVVGEVRNVVTIQDNPAVEELTSIAKNLCESEMKILSILRGEQDVFIAACRDFYNNPAGLPNTPCQDPWKCFGCSNALWTSRILPRLYKFLSFIEEQRLLLHPIDWAEKFGMPFDVITKQILPRFQKRVTEWAKSEADSTPFYIPAHLREV